MKTVYVLTSGSYDDYHPSAVFEHEEDAKAAVAAGAGDDYVTLTLFGPSEQPRRAFVYCAAASVERTDDKDVAPHAVAHERWVFDVEPRPVELHEIVNTGGGINLRAEGEDADEALAAVVEGYARLAAARNQIEVTQ